MSSSLLNCSINYVVKFCNSFPFSNARLDCEDFNWELYMKNSELLKLDTTKNVKGCLTKDLLYADPDK